jgi:hypothetical protein
VEQTPKAVRKIAATEPARAESRKRRSGEGRSKHPRLQFLNDGSPLLE